MSKNVAVFVDVANVFYAAKAAGVDIDYVQMLKTATAGRDLVRAYAYTGLDPENENQRQFHSFLARHGYKVVSKDIRKYGDGKTKANLDIELVVDLMRTSHNLDIAVVVSGDGDFAPAIRAVQDQGVRVEVISFRANTSSDLIDVADLFTDITQIAKVEKGSSRSGRRVASDEEDLSMTAVPEKESEGTGRRRRGGRGRGGERAGRDGERIAPERIAPERIAPEVAASEAEGLVAMPGERLSRMPHGGPSPLPSQGGVEAAEAGAEEAGTEGARAGQEAEADGEGGRRRRRRRGGRGRGRSRDREAVADELPSGDEGQEPEAEYEAPRLPQHSAFGSVWDSQLGVTPGSVPTGEPFDIDEDDEPEIPEYLLSERRQRGARGRGAVGQGARRPRGRGAYQSALDRERYGTGRSALPTPAYDGPRGGRQASPGRPSSGGPRRPRNAEPAPHYRSEERPAAVPGGQPWSEVPPELEEQLRAELARKRASEPRPAPTASSRAERVATAPEGEAAPRRTTRSRRSTAASATVSSAPEVPAEPAPPARTSRARKPAASTANAEGTVAAAESAAPKRTSRARTTKASPEAGAGEVAEAAPTPRRRTRSRTPAEIAPTEV